MTKRILTLYSGLSSQHYILVTVIALALLLHLPVVSWAVDGVIELPKTGQTTCYNTAGNKISCAGTGQDGDIQAGVAWPVPRFVDHSDGTVTDKLTGLVWAKNANLMTTRNYFLDTDEKVGDGAVTWQHALDYVAKLNSERYLGHTDWRLPNVKELISLVDYSSDYPALPQGHPFTNAKASDYWSSTSNAGRAYFAWYVSFDGGLVDYGFGNEYSITDRVVFGHVHPVRDGQCGSSDNSIICLPQTGQTKCYDFLGDEISCARTGQDGDIQAGVAWPNPRFVDHGDGTVTDKLTGLVWIKDATKDMTWQSALDYVKTLNTGSHIDWRLPNVEELISLVDYSQTDPSLPRGHPFMNTVATIYWSSTTYAGYPILACYVSFVSGVVGNLNKGYILNVRAVRGGQVDNNSTTTTASPVSTTTTTSTIPGNQCVVETIYGEHSEETELFREYRDKIICKSETGRQMIKTYYKLSPSVSEVLQNNETTKASIRRALDSLMPVIREKVKQ